MSEESKSKQILPLLIFTGASLIAEELPPLEFVLQDLLTFRGVYVLAGAPKMGKSWLAMDMSIKISNGVNFLNKNTIKCNVLYIDLETGKHSLKRRLTSLIKPETNMENWYFVHGCGSLGNGFEEQVSNEIEQKNIKVIIVDVFKKIRSMRKKNEDAYDHDYADVGALKKIADKYNICFILVTHVRKMVDDDVFNMVYGSVGLTGSVDGSMVLVRKRGEKTAMLYVTGREIPEVEMAVKINDNNGWDFLGTSQQVAKQHPLVATIMEMMKESSSWRGFSNELMLEMHKRCNLGNYDSQDVPTGTKEVTNSLKKLTYALQQENIVVIMKPRTKDGIPLIISKIG